MSSREEFEESRKSFKDYNIDELIEAKKYYISVLKTSIKKKLLKSSNDLSVIEYYRSLINVWIRNKDRVDAELNRRKCTDSQKELLCFLDS